jgi:hypothetical protein
VSVGGVMSLSNDNKGGEIMRKRSFLIALPVLVVVFGFIFLAGNESPEEEVYRIRIPESGLSKGIYPPVSLTLDDLKKSDFCPGEKCQKEFYYCILNYFTVMFDRFGEMGFCDLEHDSDFSIISRLKWSRKIKYSKFVELMTYKKPEKGMKPGQLILIVLSKSPRPEKEDIMGPFLFVSKDDDGHFF